MRRLLLTLCVALIGAVSTFAQEDITTFLGIPVDGSKAQMRQKLIAKGFTPKGHGTDERLEGEFNGTDVEVSIVTNNNKVYRIMVCDKHMVSESQIRTRFNTLVSQFEQNKRYMQISDDQRISSEENISYEVTVNDKTYEAVFFQKPKDEDAYNAHMEEFARDLVEDLKKEYTDEELANPSEELTERMTKAVMEYITICTKRPSGSALPVYTESISSRCTTTTSTTRLTARICNEPQPGPPLSKTQIRAAHGRLSPRRRGLFVGTRAPQSFSLWKSTARPNWKLTPSVRGLLR